ncbi:hypothetical protein L1049_011719 [Liquidambar formosana]|uniref:Uncharacterized protein n=1 Tax=Liquidambar formosana TaxID=63359 RepID=A0AAP0RRU0_LIQFO
MEVKLASNSLQWPQPIIPRSLSSLKPPSSSSFTTHTQKDRARALAHQFVHGSSLFGSPKSTYLILKGACSARLYEFSDEDFSKQVEESSPTFDLSNNNNHHEPYAVSGFRCEEDENRAFSIPFSSLDIHLVDDWQGRSDEVTLASIERKANSVDIPLSLRIIKKKQRWEKGFREAKEYTNCPVNKAFSSMVFIIQELQSYTLHIREVLYCEDLQKIITRVQRDLHASLVWLFQQVFSQTPALMVYVMILLANFTVFSMVGKAETVAAPSPRISHANTIETVLLAERKNQEEPKFSVSSIGDNNGGGNIRPLVNGTEGEDRPLERSMLPIQYPNAVPDEIPRVSLLGNDGLVEEEEVSLWNSMVEEASKMEEGELRYEVLDHETVRRFVSPVSVEIEEDDYSEYFKTEFVYQMGLLQDPSSPLLLCNYAQFLYLVARDYDRAEECFKRAVEVEPPDAEALSQYANFLWMVRKDEWGAEERYQQALAAEPHNPFYASKYASFLWNSGG